MQKLIWTNANGDSVDLTSGNYGITNWQGFSNTSMSIQSQQVPFHDGSVYLDALLEQRELSVTLAMDAKGDLEKRYRLRRELIEILNPKLGEGYLIYRNDFTAKRIKCIPQVPLFENNNSNDSGSPKASLSWTACDPYWEDLEEISVPLKIGVRKTIINNGDVPCGLNISLFTNDVTNPQIKNFTENKVIKLDGTFDSNISINTNFGEKSVSTQDLEFDINNITESYTSIIFVDNLGLFVAITADGVVSTSTDGINWTTRTSGLSSISFYRVIFCNILDLIVAVGSNGTIITSTDGINWTQRETGISATLRSITFSESLGLFVAVGSGSASIGIILTSPDGINWTQRETGTFSYGFNDVAYSESLGLFVAVSNQRYFCTSVDGINWQSQDMGLDNYFDSITFSETLGKFVACGSSGRIYTSPDGINWTSQTSGVSDNLSFINFVESKCLFIVLGGGVQKRLILTSPDGINWTTVVNTVSRSYSSIVYSDGLELFVGVGSGILNTSKDLSEWTVIKTATNINRVLTSVIYVKNLNLFYAITDYKYLYTSPDGINWTERLVANGAWGFYDIIYVNSLNLFVIVGIWGDIYTSSDGINWTERLRINSNFTFRGIAYSELLDLFVAVGYSYSGNTYTPKIYTSPDGINWTERTITGLSSVGLYSVTFSETLEKFVACGGYGVYGTIITSEDGINWTSQTSGVSKVLYSVAYSESLGLFVAVGGSDNVSVIITSPDGINWTQRESGVAQLRFVTYIDYLSIFVVMGNNGIVLISPDGIIWTQVFTGINNQLWSIAFSEELNLLVTVGYGFTILYSVYLPSENLISSLTSDSDMTLSLGIGENIFLIGKSSGNLSGAVRYRQKYIGV